MITQKHIVLFLVVVVIASIGGTVIAKKKGSKSQNPRVQNLSAENQDMFDALDAKQQNNIRNGKIEPGYNAWMITLALGEPYYKSEHHPVYKDYEEVWLYTKNREDHVNKEEKIIDPVNNWPSIHRVKRVKTCKVGDFFILFDRGVVAKVIKDDSEKTYGSCEINTTEEFIPIVDGKAKEK